MDRSVYHNPPHPPPTPPSHAHTHHTLPPSHNPTIPNELSPSHGGEIPPIQGLHSKARQATFPDPLSLVPRYVDVCVWGGGG